MHIGHTLCNHMLFCMAATALWYTGLQLYIKQASCMSTTKGHSMPSLWPLPFYKPQAFAHCRTPRRKRNAILFFTEAAVQWLNLIFYILPNAYLLIKPCKWGSPFVFWCGWIRWTCWNTVSLCCAVLCCAGALPCCGCCNAPRAHQQIKHSNGAYIQRLCTSLSVA